MSPVAFLLGVCPLIMLSAYISNGSVTCAPLTQLSNFRLSELMNSLGPASFKAVLCKGLSVKCNVTMMASEGLLQERSLFQSPAEKVRKYVNSHLMKHLKFLLWSRPDTIYDA